MNRISQLLTLPTEILQLILKEIELKEVLLHVMPSCKRLYNISNSRFVLYSLLCLDQTLQDKFNKKYETFPVTYNSEFSKERIFEMVT